MPRNYSLPTIKTLFAEASSCAYPGCDEPLVFRDRGKTTVVAEIAHIRSEQSGGPRHDPTYTGDLDGADNLLLLCGKHHRPVDRHESAYTIAELEVWKAKQRAEAGAGTPVTDDQLRAYGRLTTEERQTLTDIARLAQRLARACMSAQYGIIEVREAGEQARRRAARAMGPMWEVDEDGNRTPIDLVAGLQLSTMEQREWDAKVEAILNAAEPSVVAARNALDEEVAVLRMFAGAFAGAAERVSQAAAHLPKHVRGDAAELAAGVAALDACVSRLWQVANGEAPEDTVADDGAENGQHE